MTTGIEKSLRESMLEWICNIGSPTRPTDSYYIQWHTADPGIDGTSNIASTAFPDRDVLAGTTPFWEVGTADDGIVQNKTAGESSAASGSQTITHFSVWSVVSAGTFYFSGELTASQAVVLGGRLTYAIGALTVTITGAA